MIDDLVYEKAKDLLRERQEACASFFQRSLFIGYNDAAAIIDRLEADGIVGPFVGMRFRVVYMDKLQIPHSPA